MKTAIIRSSWMKGYGYRLDTKPYVGGALQMKVLLEELALRKDKLSDLTQGIFHAGRESRTWVNDAELGIPFLGSSALQNANLSNLPLISKQQVLKNPAFLIRKGYTLITRSGTIGRMAYCRPEMDGLACSEHVLRVVPNPDLIPPGYLYAFLSSKFGVPLVTSGTYGSIIQSIEPEHIAGIGVPRLNPLKEQEIHELVEIAARLRSEASRLRKKAILHFETIIGWDELETGPNINISSSSILHRRMDSHFHSKDSVMGRKALEFRGANQSIGDLAPEVYSPDRGSRNKVEAEKHGIPFISSSAVFQVDPKPDYFISKNSRKIDSFLIKENDLLIPRSGPLGGIIGRAVLPVAQIYGSAATDHLVHVRCKEKRDAFFLWTALASRPGYLAILSTAFGSAIPSLDCGMIARTRVPILPTNDYLTIVDSVEQANLLSQEALESERHATSVTEHELTAL